MIKAKGKQPISADKVKSYVDRIENLEEERKAINGDVRDIYSEAKGSGYNPKALRKVIAQRRQKTDEEVEVDVERYRLALGMSSYRAVAEQFGVSKSKLQRLVPRKEKGTPPPHDPLTGEVGEDARQGEGLQAGLDTGCLADVCRGATLVETVNEPNPNSACPSTPPQPDNSSTPTGGNHADVRGGRGVDPVEHVPEAGGGECDSGDGRGADDDIRLASDAGDVAAPGSTRPASHEAEESGRAPGNGEQAPLKSEIGAEPRLTGEPHIETVDPWAAADAALALLQATKREKGIAA